MSELQRCFGQHFRGSDELRFCKSDPAVGAGWEVALTLGIFMKVVNHATEGDAKSFQRESSVMGNVSMRHGEQRPSVGSGSSGLARCFLSAPQIWPVVSAFTFRIHSFSHSTYRNTGPSSLLSPQVTVSIPLMQVNSSGSSADADL